MNLVNRLRFAKLKLSILVIIINNLLADLLIRPTFFCRKLEKSRFAKLSSHQTFLLYGITLLILMFSISMIPHHMLQNDERMYL